MPYGPRAVPFAPGQRQEQEDVDEFARCVQREFGACGATGWQALDQFVIPQCVQRA
jgi:hypothetical protein